MFSVSSKPRRDEEIRGPMTPSWEELVGTMSTGRLDNRIPVAKHYKMEQLSRTCCK